MSSRPDAAGSLSAPAVPFKAGRRGLLAGLASLGAATATSPAKAAVDPALLDIRRYVYIPEATSDRVVVVDSETNSVTATLNTGVVAGKVVVSRDTATLIAADSNAPRLSLVNVFSGDRRFIDLPVRATGLTIGTTGVIAAAFDASSGTISLIDLDEGRIKSTVSGPPHLHDVMFGGDDARLFVGADGLSGIGVIDVEAGRLTRQIPISRQGSSSVSAFARTPDGRNILVLPSDRSQVSIIDPELGKIVTQLASTDGAEGLFPSGTGNYLLIPDTGKSVLRIFSSAKLATGPVELAMSAGIIGVYFAWLDSVVFVPSSERNQLLVYDLDRMRQIDAIKLPGSPLPGTVTADSRTLYLPLHSPSRLVAISGEKRQIVSQIDLGGAPQAALVAGGWGICH